MTAKQFYHDIDLVSVGQITNTRIHNVDNTGQTTLEGSLGVANKGLMIFNTEDQLAGASAAGVFKIWNGTAFVAQALNVDGDVIFRGTVDASLAIDDGGQSQVVEAKAGYQYVVTTAGTFDAGSSGVTLVGSQSLEVGDQILFTSTTQAYAIQRNDAEATEAVLGNVRLASQTEADDGSGGTKVITSEKLEQSIKNRNLARQYTQSLNLTAATPATVTHNLALQDRDAFVVNCMLGNSQISVDIDSVDANSLTLTSLIALTGVRVTVLGAEATA